MYYIPAGMYRSIKILLLAKTSKCSGSHLGRESTVIMVYGKVMEMASNELQAKVSQSCFALSVLDKVEVYLYMTEIPRP